MNDKASATLAMRVTISIIQIVLTIFPELQKKRCDNGWTVDFIEND